MQFGRTICSPVCQPVCLPTISTSGWLISMGACPVVEKYFDLNASTLITTMLVIRNDSPKTCHKNLFHLPLQVLRIAKPKCQQSSLPARGNLPPYSGE